MLQETEPAIDAQRQRTAEPRGSAAPQPTTSARRAIFWRAFHRLWRMLPRRCRRLAVRLAAPKVTMGACAVIQDERGRVLLAHHLYREHAWGLPGGFVRTSEQPAAGLARELREELGVQALVGPVLSAEINTTTRQLTLYYRATLLGTPRQDGIEIDALRYAAPEEVSNLLGNQANASLNFTQPIGN